MKLRLTGLHCEENTKVNFSKSVLQLLFPSLTRAILQVIFLSLYYRHPEMIRGKKDATQESNQTQSGDGEKCKTSQRTLMIPYLCDSEHCTK